MPQHHFCAAVAPQALKNKVILVSTFITNLGHNILQSPVSDQKAVFHFVFTYRSLLDRPVALHRGYIPAGVWIKNKDFGAVRCNGERLHARCGGSHGRGGVCWMNAENSPHSKRSAAVRPRSQMVSFTYTMTRGLLRTTSKGGCPTCQIIGWAYSSL